MARVVFILGLAAAGKTTHAMKMLRDHPYCFWDEGFLVCDERGNLDEAKTKPHCDWLVGHLRQGHDCIVIEGGFMFEPAQDYIEGVLQREIPEAKIKWLAFRNDPQRAAINARKRGRDPEGNIRQNVCNSPRYHIPLGAEVLEIVTD